jgi:hypothetical protein
MWRCSLVSHNLGIGRDRLKRRQWGLLSDEPFWRNKGSNGASDPVKSLELIPLLELRIYRERGSRTVKMNLGTGGNTEVILFWEIGTEYLFKEKERIRKVFW